MAKKDSTPNPQSSLELAETLGLDPQTVGKAQRAYRRVFALVRSSYSRQRLLLAAVAEAGLRGPLP